MNYLYSTAGWFLGLLSARRVRWALVASSALGMLSLLAGALLFAPREAVEGDVQRVFYIHVPMAWVAYLAFAIVFIASAFYLWKHEPRWDILARSSAEIGLVFTTLVLTTGAIWGRPIWGTWWAWDARLTTTLILWVLYAGYLAVRAFAGQDEPAMRFAAVVGILAFLDVPIVHLSVTWWRTLHPQPIVVRPLGTQALPGEMLIVLGIGLVAMSLFYLALLSMRFSSGIIEWRMLLARRRAIARATRSAPVSSEVVRPTRRVGEPG